MTALLDPADPVSANFREAIGTILAEFLADRRQELGGIAPLLSQVVDVAAALCAGGKRIRPAFVAWGRVAVAGQPSAADPLLRAAASMELWHVGILVHDDLMDASDTRRGLPAAHRSFASWHSARGRFGRPEEFGAAGAILLGTQLVAWSEKLLRDSNLSSEEMRRAHPVVDVMRDEVLAGQWLDVAAQAGLSDPAWDARAVADRVVEYKTSRYTVQRPVQFGAMLGDGSRDVLAGLSEFGDRIGRAFQYRDDLLGVFGESATTGKPSGGDLQEGKRTALVAETLARADSSAAAQLEELLGVHDLDEAGVAQARAIITESGASRAIEQRIGRDYHEALQILDELDITEDGHIGLTNLARACVQRDS